MCAKDGDSQTFGLGVRSFVCNADFSDLRLRYKIFERKRLRVLMWEAGQACLRD